jgi:hypothetical protein
MILTHRDVISDLSARSLIRSDAGPLSLAMGKGRATRSESSEKTQGLSPLGRVEGCQQALEMSRIAPGSTRGLLPTRCDPEAIPMGQYHQDLVLNRRINESSVVAGPGERSAHGCLPRGLISPSNFEALSDVLA